MIKLHNADCLTWLAANHDIKVDHIIVDLPYFKVVRNDFDNQWNSVAEYLDWIEQIFSLVKPILKPNGSLFVFTSRQLNRHICMILDKFFEEQRIIIWARKRAFNNTRGRSLASGYEPIAFYCNGDNPTFNNIKIKPDSSRKEYTEGILKDGITMSDIWSDIPALPHNSKEKVDHPTQKPLKLMERIVEQFTNEGDVVLDFCMGSGSTGVACKELNRSFIGIEKDQAYFEIAKSRLEEPTVFVPGLF